MAKRKTVVELETEIARVTKSKDDYYQSYRTAQDRATAAEEGLKESRTHFADLKERLANAEAETARLRGYLARVHEDDIVRDGLVEVEDGDGKRSVPRRPPPLEAFNP
jgi:chromosome segregation ATPase